MTNQPANYSFTNKEDIRFQTIVDLISLATGLDIAISSIKKGEISPKATQEIRQLIFQSYIILANKQAFSVLQEQGLVSEEDSIDQFQIVIDTPDDTHEDIIIEYLARSL